ncbi:MAG: isochorismatase family protein [Verrucomicrobium sp.]|nr:isochorismatase family protein [Verrucomicrobium sp.]
MSASTTDKGLLTPGNCAVVFIDFQPPWLAEVSGTNRETLLQNILVLAKAALIFDVPVIFTCLYSSEPAAALRELFPHIRSIARSTMNAWDCPEFQEAVRRTGRRNLVMAALWSEVSLTMPALQALTDGFGVYAVEDASEAASTAVGAQAAAIRRIEQAGAVSITALQLLLEFQRDWSRPPHQAEVLAVMHLHCRHLRCAPPALPG